MGYNEDMIDIIIKSNINRASKEDLIGIFKNAIRDSYLIELIIPKLGIKGTCPDTAAEKRSYIRGLLEGSKYWDKTKD